MDHRWNGFLGGAWTERIDVRDFIQSNYTPYAGGAGFRRIVLGKPGGFRGCRLFVKPGLFRFPQEISVRKQLTLYRTV